MKSICLGLFLCSIISIDAQTTRRRGTAKKPAPAITQADTKPPANIPPKKNERPNSRADVVTQEPANQQPIQGTTNLGTINTPTHFYEFTQPAFLISKVIIEHDDAGKGQISFMKKGYGELISDPIQISAAALDRISNAFTALNFLDSSENYQYEKDFSHLGVSKIRLKNDGRERTAVFNWTQNKDAKILAEEYRKIGNQFIWMFDIAVARENQPLETPKLLDSLDSLIRRNEISDSKQMVSFLQKLTNDERIPLIARNHAGKLIKQVEKQQ